MNLEELLSQPEESLALGVLRQAVHDLRRFQHASGRLERELYTDAYRWITDSDFSWPYSFINICKLLDLSPEMLRTELLADVSLTPLRYWCRIGARFTRTCGASLGWAFTPSRKRYRVPIAPQLTH